MQITNWNDNTIQCRNCDTVTEGKYCHGCGQKSVVHRLTLDHLLHEIPHAVFHVDRGFFATIWQLLRQPGVAINNYLDGKRARYFNPLTLLIISVGVGVFYIRNIHLITYQVQMRGCRLKWRRSMGNSGLRTTAISRY